MKTAVRKKPVKRKRRWFRRLVVVTTTTLLIVAVAVGILLANLKGIVLRVLRARLPGLRVSVEDVSLRSLSHLEVTGLKIEGDRGEKGSVLRLPLADVRFRLTLFKGIVLESLDFVGATVSLRPGMGAISSSLAEATRKQGAGRERGFPAGSSIGRIALRNSRVLINMPDLDVDCSLDALADSSSTGTLLNDTGLSFRVRIASFKVPSLRLRDLETDLSVIVDRAHTGKRIDFRRGGLKVGDFLRSDFQGHLSFAGKDLETEGAFNVELFSVADLIPRLKESFPELDRYAIDGESDARFTFRYSPAREEQLVLSGDVSLTKGRAVVPFLERIVAENVDADIPFRYGILDGKTTLSLGPRVEHPAGVTVGAARVAYGKEEVASGLRASLELENDTLKFLDASFRFHEGKVNTRLSGSLQAREVNLRGDVDLHDIDLEKVSRVVNLGNRSIGGNATGKANLIFSAGEKKPIALGGAVTVAVPEGTVHLKKPLWVSQLTIDTPFEYRLASGVESLEIRPTESHPAVGRISAKEISYGEKATAAESPNTPWMASDVEATVLSSDEGVEFTITAGRAHEGHVSGNLITFWEKEGLGYRGELNVKKLDLARLARALGAKEEKLEVKGRAEGRFSFSGTGGKWKQVEGQFSSLPPGGMVRIEQKREISYKLARAKLLYPPLEPRPKGAFGLDIELRFEASGTGENLEKLLDSLRASEVVLKDVKKRYAPQEWKTVVRDWDITVQIPITLEKERPPESPLP